LQKDLAAKEQEIAALGIRGMKKESTSRISPLWLIPAALVTMAVTALMIALVKNNQ